MMNCYCGEPIKAKSLCQKHYLKDYRERKAAGQIKEKTTLIFDDLIDLWHCKVTGCDDKPRAKQLCTKHYFQHRRAQPTCCPFCKGKCMNCGANSDHTNLCDNCKASARRIY